MKTIQFQTIWQVIGLGTIAGMRSMSAPAVAAYMLRNEPIPFDDLILKLIRSEKFTKIITILAAAELIADKLPFAPARIKPASIMVRSITGALSSMLIAKENNDDKKTAGRIGLVAAIVSTFAFYYLRRETGKKLKIDDYLLGITEDILAAGLGLSLIQSVQ
ncbi:MAG: DUF4126 family protein [Mucilaginibacter sp.]